MVLETKYYRPMGMMEKDGSTYKVIPTECRLCVLSETIYIRPITTLRSLVQCVTGGMRAFDWLFMGHVTRGLGSPGGP